VTITARIKKNFEENGERCASELAKLDEFKDLTLEQIQNGIARVRNPEKDRDYYRRNPNYLLWRNARSRSIKKNIYFDLKREDIVIPTRCPILGMPLFSSVGNRGGGPASPTVDRIDPTKGYTKENVHVISRRANTLKSDASPEELRKICEWIRNYWLEKDS
jgi:hypothetical protein